MGKNIKPPPFFFCKNVTHRLTDWLTERSTGWVRRGQIKLLSPPLVHAIGSIRSEMTIIWPIMRPRCWKLKPRKIWAVTSLALSLKLWCWSIASPLSACTTINMSLRTRNSHKVTARGHNLATAIDIRNMHDRKANPSPSAYHNCPSRGLGQFKNQASSSLCGHGCVLMARWGDWLPLMTAYYPKLSQN